MKGPALARATARVASEYRWGRRGFLKGCACIGTVGAAKGVVG